MTKEEFEYELHLRNQTLNSRFSYWNALLFFNTIIIATFTALSSTNSNYNFFYSLIVLLSVFSSTFLILDYRITKKFIDNDRDNKLTEFEKLLPNDVLKYMWTIEGVKKKKQVKFFETMSELVLIFQFILILYVSFKDFFDNLIDILKSIKC